MSINELIVHVPWLAECIKPPHMHRMHARWWYDISWCVIYGYLQWENVKLVLWRRT